MGDDNKLKQELYYMVRLTSKYDFENMELVEGILRLENERHILNSVFGSRFKRRIFDIAAGVSVDYSCVICGQPANNKVICAHCMETIGGSEYAKSHLPQKSLEKKFDIKKKLIALVNKLSIKNNKKEDTASQSEKINRPVIVEKKTVIRWILAVFLLVILIIQLWILSLWNEIKKYNPKEPEVLSSVEATPVSSIEEAYATLALDFPESLGYTITYARMDTDFVGRFKLKKGACCEEVEEKLTEDERYDYFFTEDVYVFYISYNEEYAARVGLAEINSEGNILLLGSFNDGRNTSYHYKIR